MATDACSTITRSGAIQTFNKLVCRSRITHLEDVMSKKLFGVCRATLGYFDLNFDFGDTELPNAEEVYFFINQSLPPPNLLFGEELFRMPLIPMMVLKDIADFFRCGTPEAPLVRSVNLTTAKDVNPRIIAIVCITWLMMDSGTFTHSFIDQYFGTKEVQNNFGQHCDPAQALHRKDGEQNHEQNESERNSTSNKEIQNSGGNIYVKTKSIDKPAPVPFNGNKRRHMDDNESRSVSYLQEAISKGKRFNEDLSESIHTTLQMYELTAKQYDILPMQLAELFVQTLDGPAQLFFLREIKTSDSYKTIKKKMLYEYHSDARQLQFEGNLSQLCLRKLMQQESITNVRKGLSTLVTKIEELVTQFHLEFQTDRHKIRYLCDAVAKF